MQVRDIDLTDRLPEDQSQTITLDLGRTKAQVTQPLDWDPRYVPVKVVTDPQGRTWEPIVGTDTGTACELSTPMEGT